MIRAQHMATPFMRGMAADGAGLGTGVFLGGAVGGGFFVLAGYGGFERADALAEGGADAGESGGAENQQDDEEDDDEFEGAEAGDTHNGQ